MKNFFKFEPTVAKYFINKNQIKQFWNYDEMYSETIDIIRNIDIINHFAMQLNE